MSILDLWNNWKKFWFKSESPLSVCIFRIAFALIVLEYCFLLYPDLLNWFGVHGICSAQSSKQVFEFLGPTGLNVFDWLPRDDNSARIVFWSLVISAISIALGFFTRLSAVCVYVALASLQQQNGLVINGGEILLKMTAFYMIFAPAGHCLSLDSFLHKRTKPLLAQRSYQDTPSGWPQQLCRFLIALIYFQAFWSKLEDKSWLDGTALYYVLRQQEYLRFPVEWMSNSLWMCQTFTWGTLIIEAAIFSLIWFKETRYFVLVAALFLHCGIEYTMNLPIFETLMIAFLILFVPSEDIRRVFDWLRLAYVNNFNPEPVATRNFQVQQRISQR